MPVFSLDEELIFPHPVLRERDGLLAIGGSLSVDRLLLAYRWGIFPWYSDGQPILWWWTCPRPLIATDALHVSHSVRNYINQNRYTITMNKDFESVIQICSKIPRREQEGTWITHEMMTAYINLHLAGHAHSVEVWSDGELCGGLYGVWIGNIYSGESMFSLKSNASKVGFVWLVEYLREHGCEWVDCQQDTPHMRTMGSFLLDEQDYLEILRKNQNKI